MCNIAKLFIKGTKINYWLSYGKSNANFQQRQNKNDVRVSEQKAILRLPEGKASVSINKSVLFFVKRKPLSSETVSLKNSITGQKSLYVV
jgi:hypothetical protein